MLDFLPCGQIDAARVVLQLLWFGVDDAEAMLVGTAVLEIVEDLVDAEFLGAVQVGVVGLPSPWNVPVAVQIDETLFTIKT